MTWVYEVRVPDERSDEFIYQMVHLDLIDCVEVIREGDEEED